MPTATFEPEHYRLPIGLLYLRQPFLVLVICCVMVALAAMQIGNFRFDASSDTLVVEGDPDLAQYEKIVDAFGGEDFIFMTFSPVTGQPISPAGLAVLEELVADLAHVDGVRSVFSILDAPLLKSPPVELTSLLDGFPTLRSESTDQALAQQELTNSPFFRELLITSDGAASAIKIDLIGNEALREAGERVDGLSDDDKSFAAEQARAHLRDLKEADKVEREALVSRLRAVRDEYSDRGTLYIGGVPMIAADMITYVKSDISVFGGVVLALMIVALWLFFRRPRWVLLPILSAGAAITLTIGLLALLDWQATVISSNFVSLLGITTISLTIHLIVHYRELRLTNDELSRDVLVYQTMRAKFAPCFYTALTTIAAFGSLTVSGILPVEYFGWMMCIGILLSFVTTYTLFPAILLLLPKGPAAPNLGKTNNFIRGLGEYARWRSGLLVVLSVFIAFLAYVGIGKVSLDNRFAEYFDPDTDIFQGMNFIDRNLGGTIPFDVVLQFPPYEEEPGSDDGDDFDDFFEDEPDPYPERYWFARDMLDRLELVHRFVDEQPQVGKVLGLTALEDFALEFTGGEKLGNLEIVAILGAVPADLHRQIIAPYANPRSGELRISGRIIESGPSFDREEFRQEIINFAVDEAGFTRDQVTVSGMMVLFNGMLSKLLDSQLNTLAYILLVVFVMFLILLRSLHHALLGMIPNTLASASVIGAMGFFGVPLDMMTTTIAAVCIGIGVDDTIHYLHRFREEFSRYGDARTAVSFCHESIGRALYYTSLTVVIGFSVLAFSNFVPTVMFGLWTAVAMLLALLANLTLLPAMLVLTHRRHEPTEPQIRSDVVDPQQAG